MLDSSFLKLYLTKARVTDPPILSGHSVALSQHTSLVGTPRRVRVAQDTLAIISQLHHTAVPLTLLSGIIGRASLKEALAYLESRALVTVTPSMQTLDVHRLEWQKLRMDLQNTIDQPDYLRLALQSLDERFPTAFARPRCLHRGLNLSEHVASALQAVVQRPLALAAFEQTAYLALRYCMYLITVGSYRTAKEFLSGFVDWSRDLLPSQFNIATALAGKQAVVEALLGSLQVSSRLNRTIRRARVKVYGPGAAETVHSLNNTALVCHGLGQDELALMYHWKALSYKNNYLAENDSDTLVTVTNLAVVLQGQGQHMTAEQMFHRALRGWTALLDHDDLFVLAARSNMGIAICLQGRLDDAEALHRSVLADRQRILGPTHHETLKSRANLAHTIHKKGKYAQAEAQYRDILKRFQDNLDLGPSHPDTLRTYTNLASALAHQAKYEEAEAVVLEALPLIQTQFGPTHTESLKAMETRVVFLQYQHNFATGVAVASEVYGARLLKFGFEHMDTQRSLRHLRDLREDLEEAETAVRFSALTPTAVV